MKKRLFTMIIAMLLLVTGCSPKIQGENLMKDVKTGDAPVTRISDVDSA